MKINYEDIKQEPLLPMVIIGRIIIGHRQSKSTFGANQTCYLIKESRRSRSHNLVDLMQEFKNFYTFILFEHKMSQFTRFSHFEMFEIVLLQK